MQSKYKLNSCFCQSVDFFLSFRANPFKSAWNKEQWRKIGASNESRWLQAENSLHVEIVPQES